MIILETIKTEKKFFNFKHPKIYMYLGVIVAFIAVLFVVFNDGDQDFNSLKNVFYQISFAALVLFSISSVINKFFKEDIIITKTGKIKITENAFLVNDIEISFKEITHLDLNITDYAGNTTQNTSTFNNMFSAGTQNYISIIFKHQQIKKQVLINSEREIALLFSFLSSLIIQEKFTEINPKQTIHFFTSEFRKTDKARDYIAKQIKNGTLKPTEGLLMMNYTSDKEVKELRKKYNL